MKAKEVTVTANLFRCGLVLNRSSVFWRASSPCGSPVGREFHADVIGEAAGREK